MELHEGRLFSGILRDYFSKFQPRMRLGVSAQILLDALLTEHLDTMIWVLKRASASHLSIEDCSADLHAFSGTAALRVTHKMVQAILRKTFAEELRRFAFAEGSKAVGKYLRGVFPGDEERTEEVIFNPNEHSRDDNLFKRTSLDFPCARIGCWMVEAGLQPTIEAVVCLTATLEYTAAELMECAGSAAGARDKARVEDLVGGKHMNASDVLAARMKDASIEQSYPCLIPISDAFIPVSNAIYSELLIQAMMVHKNDLLKPWESTEPLPGLSDTTTNMYLDLSLPVAASLLGGKAIEDADEYRDKVADPLISYIRTRSEETRLCVPVSILTLSRYSWTRRHAAVYHWNVNNGTASA
jgi:hypothetical protein